MAAPAPHPHNQITVSPWKPAQMIEVVQGGYYILAGLLVAVAIVSIQGPADHPRTGAELWLVRVIALVVAGFGAALLWSGLQKGPPFIPSGVALVVALILLAQSVAAMALGQIPLTFLLDAALEGLFVGWWAVTMFVRVGGAGAGGSSSPVTP